MEDFNYFQQVRKLLNFCIIIIFFLHFQLSLVYQLKILICINKASFIHSKFMFTNCGFVIRFGKHEMQILKYSESRP